MPTEEKPTEEISALETTLSEAVDSEFGEDPKPETPAEELPNDAAPEKSPKPDDSEETPKSEEKPKEEPPKESQTPQPEEGEGKFFYITNKKGEKRRVSEKEFLEREAEVTRNQQSRSAAEKELQQARQVMNWMKRAKPEAYAEFAALAAGDPEKIKELPPDVQAEILDAARTQKTLADNDSKVFKERVQAIGNQVQTDLDEMLKDETSFPGAKDQESDILEFILGMTKATGGQVIPNPRQAYNFLNAETITARHSEVLKAKEADIDKLVSERVDATIKAMTADEWDKMRGSTPAPGGTAPEKPKPQYPKNADLEDEMAIDLEQGGYNLFK